MFQIKYSKKAIRDIQRLKNAKLDKKAKALVDLITENPYRTPPPYEVLLGELAGKLARRINIKHRLVYQVFGASGIMVERGLSLMVAFLDWLRRSKQVASSLRSSQ